MKRLSILGLFFFMSIVLIGQGFKGRVVDIENKPIQYAQVYFVELNTGTTTDENGNFFIEHFNQERIHIQISFIGYKMLDEIVDLKVGKEMVFILKLDHFDLKELLVSASTGRLQGENIVSIDHKRISDLQVNSPITLAEAISNIPGVEQATTGPGIGKPVIRGLSGNRIVTYAQGMRIENQQWGDEHGLGVGEVGIESIEVIKGPASLLYGSDAMGGVLYFVDERYADHNNVEGFAQTKFLSNTLSSISNLGFKIHKGRLKFNLFAAYSTNADFQLASFDRVFNTRFDEKNFKASFGYNTKNWISNLRYSYLQNNYGIVEEDELTNSIDRNFILPFQNISNHNVSFENTLFTKKSKVNVVVAYANNYRKEYEDDIENQALGLLLNTYSYTIKWYSPRYKDKFDFIIGSQGMAQENKNNGEEILIPDASTNDFGALVLANLYIDDFQFQGGLRGDIRQIISKEMRTNQSTFPAINNKYTGFTFSSGVIYTFGRSKLRLNLSSAFRAPNTSELLSDGVHEGSNRYEKGNVNLHNENATQIDISYDFDSEHFQFSINPFYNIIENYIYLSPNDSLIDNSPVYEYLQTNAFLYGGEIGFHYHPHSIHFLHLESNLSTVFAEDKNNNPLPLIPQTKINTSISAAFSRNGKLNLINVFVQHIYKFKQDRVGQFETETMAYNLINLGLKLELFAKSRRLEINVGINNIFNVVYTDHLSRFKERLIPNQGINVHLGLKYNFITSLKDEN
jgi:iron complex outermembrane receptor protein